ncbi:MAG: ammonium transporter [Proteobacteria bacterium]|nr:ammonium transporter [Pseudomonadota bacterium]
MTKTRIGTGLALLVSLLLLPSLALAEEAAAAAPSLNSGDTAWMLASTALVLMMTIPGLALFYGGLVRKQNMLATTMQSFATCSLVAVVWAVAGYSLAFTNGMVNWNGATMMGDFSRFLFSGVDHTVPFTIGAGLGNAVKTTIPEPVYMTFQMTFAIITPALITGAFADRIKFSSMLVFMGLWSLLVYSPIAHWVWHPAGFLFKMGVLDYAGGTVVHLNAGIAGLVAAIVIGPKLQGTVTPPAYNPVFALIGASLLWVGWIGFNAGSALAADGRAAMACAVTIIAAAMAALSWMAVEWADRGRPSLTGKVTGAVAGLVGITPASGFVDVPGAIAIGFAAGVVCYLAVSRLKKAFKVDDSLDCFYVHGIGGAAGAILTGVFASKAISGTAGSLQQVIIQLAAIGTTVLWCGAVTAVILKAIDLTMGLRVSADVEKEGLDTALHGEQIH